jgi:hypothetical protein
MGSVRLCRAHRSRPVSENSSGSSPRRRPAGRTWRRVGGPRAFAVHGAAERARTRCENGLAANAPSADTRYR